MKRNRSRLTLPLIAVAFCAALYTVAPTANAGVLGFGQSSFGQTGLGPFIGDTNIATPIVTTNLVGRTIVQIAAGSSFSLLVADDGSVFSCGTNGSGQLGQGNVSFIGIATPIVTTNLGGRTIVQAAASSNHSLLVADDGTVFSIGSNNAGQLGLGTSGTAVNVATPIDSTNLGARRITQIAAGGINSLLLADDGSVFSMGTNAGGRTGLGITSGVTTVATPIDTSNLGGRKITQVAAGDSHSLLLADDGSVFSFGFNSSGQRGIGPVGGPPIATPIVSTNLGGRKITQIAADGEHSLLLADDGSVFSFGSNTWGQLGLGTTGGYAAVATPIDATNLGGLKISEVSAGRLHSLIKTEDGRAFSFGDNSNGRLGLGATGGIVPVPTPINTTNLGGQIISQLAAGGSFNLLLAEPALPGDFNKDGIVDSADYVVWRKTSGQSGAVLAADGDQDHQIDTDDYNVWRAHFGTSLGSSSYATSSTYASTIPEPATLLLIFAAAAITPFRLPYGSRNN
jgi:alpha-tubulin suppressor-like RCC1 family protein